MRTAPRLAACLFVRGPQRSRLPRGLPPKATWASPAASRSLLGVRHPSGPSAAGRQAFVSPSCGCSKALGFPGPHAPATWDCPLRSNLIRAPGPFPAFLPHGRRDPSATRFPTRLRSSGTRRARGIQSARSCASSPVGGCTRLTVLARHLLLHSRAGARSAAGPSCGRPVESYRVGLCGRLGVRSSRTSQPPEARVVARAKEGAAVVFSAEVSSGFGLD